MRRRHFLGGAVGVGIAASLGLVANGGFGGRQFNLDQRGLIEPGPTVGLEPIATGFGFPVDMAVQPDADRRYVATRSGRVLVHESDGVRSEPALDISDRVLLEGEQGLLGIALHPSFPSNRRVYLRYSSPRREGTPESYAHTFVLSEFETSEDYRRLRPETERPILELPNPHRFHNAGDMAFGPDGYLYVGVGDGGHTYDQGPHHVEDWYDWNQGGNGQDVTENLFGSILRLDIDAREDGKPYGIPDDNPLVDEPGLDEHFAWGLRNPWKLSFNDGDLFVGDVGQGDYEEVNIVEKGGNYGWNVREGPQCLNAPTTKYFPLVPLPWCPDETPSGRALQDPIIQYPHQVRTLDGVVHNGQGVVGGYIYRGDVIPELRDRYVFGDLASPTYGGGRLFLAERPDQKGEQWPMREVIVADTESGRIDGMLIGFGTNDAGTLYTLTFGSNGGSVSKLVPAGT